MLLCIGALYSFPTYIVKKICEQFIQLVEMEVVLSESFFSVILAVFMAFNVPT